MAISYVCRKCRKTYSTQDCSENTFCKQCGSFLIKQFTVAIQPTLPKSTYQHYTNPEVTPSKRISAPTALQNAAERLQEKGLSSKEYVVASELEKPVISGQGIQNSFVFESDFNQALRLKAELDRKYKGKRIEDVLTGKVISNEQGECYCVIQNHQLLFERASYEESKRMLLANLKIVPGIGTARNQQLKSQGYQTIQDLEKHPKWKNAATVFLRMIETKDTIGLQERIRRVLPKSHPLAHYLAGFCHDEDFTIIDIETMGMFGRPIILLGVAEASRNNVVTRQYLVRDVSEEVCVLSEFTSMIKATSALISYNGRCFDIPFIRERLAYYGLDSENALDVLHFDMLHFARRAFRGRFADYRLETIESYLGIHRNINIPSALVPEFYDSYRRSGNVGALVPIMEHNQQDLVTLAQLFCSLYKEYD